MGVGFFKISQMDWKTSHRIERLFIGRSSPNDFAFLITPFFLLVDDNFKNLLDAEITISQKDCKTSHRIERLFIGRSSPNDFSF